MTKPTVTVRCVANAYAAPNERIIEVGNGKRSDREHAGALIALRNLPDGTLAIHVYRADAVVTVRGPDREG